VILGAALAASCSDSTTIYDAKAHVVQLVDVAYAPATIQCRGGAVQRDIQFNVHMVNTTSDTVTVTAVKVHSVVIRASKDTLVGKTAWESSNVPFAPHDGVLRANDGDVTYSVYLSVVCVAGGVARPDFIDVGLTLLVDTSVGEYASKMLTIRQDYQ